MAQSTSCPTPPRTDGFSELGKLDLFSKTLFYVREHHPEGVGSRARELLVKALEAVASQDREVLVEQDSDRPPRWVRITVAAQQCTLNVERMDAPWSLRSTLQQGLRFVQGHLKTTGSPAERLMRIEIAATNGMLSALDERSRLMDAETYREVQPYFRKRPGPTAADAGAIRTHDSQSANGAIATPMRAATGPAVTYLRLSSFPPGVSVAVEQALAASERERPKGSSSTCATTAVDF